MFSVSGGKNVETVEIADECEVLDKMDKELLMMIEYLDWMSSTLVNHIIFAVYQFFINLSYIFRGFIKLNWYNWFIYYLSLFQLLLFSLNFHWMIALIITMMTRSHIHAVIVPVYWDNLYISKEE